MGRPPPSSRASTCSRLRIRAGRGPQRIEGNNISIPVRPDSRADADRLFNALAQGGTITMPIADQFWGDYFGSLTDRFGINWMVNYADPAARHQ